MPVQLDVDTAMCMAEKKRRSPKKKVKRKAKRK